MEHLGKVSKSHKSRQERVGQGQCTSGGCMQGRLMIHPETANTTWFEVVVSNIVFIFYPYLGALIPIWRYDIFQMALSKGHSYIPSALLTTLEGARPGRLVTHSSRWNTKAVSLIGLQSILYLYVYMSIWNTHDLPGIYIQSLQRTPDYRTWNHGIIQISEWYIRPKFESGHHMCITTAYDNPYNIQLGAMIPRLFLNKTTTLHDMFIPGDMWRNPTQVKGPSWSQQWRTLPMKPAMP